MVMQVGTQKIRLPAGAFYSEPGLQDLREQGCFGGSAVHSYYALVENLERFVPAVKLCLRLSLKLMD